MGRVVLVATGGTISTRDRGQGATPTLRGADLLREVPGLEAVADVAVEEFAFIPGAHMTLEAMARLAGRVTALLAGDADGVVVTHGTDTLEETAYLLWLTVPSEKPVVVTGAMRNSSQVGFDGYRNLHDAVRLAASAEARGLGPVVCLNEEFHSARWVTKTSGQKEDTFKSPATGPLGALYGDRVALFTRPARQPAPLRPVLERNVDLIRLAVDCDDRFVRASIERGARGVVLETFGGGRVPTALLPAIDEAIERGIVVAATTRTHGGGMWDMYGYEGAYRDLVRRGVRFGQDIPGHKLRLALMVALGNGLAGDALAGYLAREA